MNNHEHRYNAVRVLRPADDGPRRALMLCTRRRCTATTFVDLHEDAMPAHWPRSGGHGLTSARIAGETFGFAEAARRQA